MRTQEAFLQQVPIRVSAQTRKTSVPRYRNSLVDFSGRNTNRHDLYAAATGVTPPTWIAMSRADLSNMTSMSDKEKGPKVTHLH